MDSTAMSSSATMSRMEIGGAKSSFQPYARVHRTMQPIDDIDVVLINEALRNSRKTFTELKNPVQEVTARIMAPPLPAVPTILPKEEQNSKESPGCPDVNQTPISASSTAYTVTPKSAASSMLGSDVEDGSHDGSEMSEESRKKRRPYNFKNAEEKDTMYRISRQKNNDAVRKCREKKERDRLKEEKLKREKNERIVKLEAELLQLQRDAHTRFSDMIVLTNEISTVRAENIRLKDQLKSLKDTLNMISERI